MEFQLYAGAHEAGENRRCAAEWVAWLAGEPHTDRPQSMSLVLREFVTWLNDDLEDEARQDLRPYLARMVGTANDGLDQKRADAMRRYAARTPHGTHFAR